MWALKEETDGIFLSYTVVQGTPSVCDALAKSRNEFYQASQSRKVVMHRLPLKQEPRHNLLYKNFFAGNEGLQKKRHGQKFQNFVYFSFCDNSQIVGVFLDFRALYGSIRVMLFVHQKSL